MAMLVFCVMAGLSGIVARRCLARNWFSYPVAFVIPFFVMLTIYGIFPIGFDGKVLSKVDEDIMSQSLIDADRILEPLADAVRKLNTSSYEITDITIEWQPPARPFRVAPGPIQLVWYKNKFVWEELAK
ncbi:MAG: hypothetical protein WC390_10190 [Sulfurimonas sp.]|jgi:hypothetical protein